MKKCPYCGKEYADDVARCLIDDEPLCLMSGDDANPQTSPPIQPSKPPFAFSSDRQMRICELTLVCIVAFSGPILASAHSYFTHGNDSPTSTRGAYSFFSQALRQGSALALLWYVLARSKRSFSGLGLAWARHDLGWSIVLEISEVLAFGAVYWTIFSLGLTTTTHAMAAERAGGIVFGARVSVAAFLFQFLNPFFEELIVRAYVMTEIKYLTQSVWAAIIVSTILQSSYHLYQGLPATLSHAAAFFISSVFYARTNRITPVILAHFYSDVGPTLWYAYNH